MDIITSAPSPKNASTGKSSTDSSTSSTSSRSSLEQLKVIQLIAVLHDVALNLAADRPRDKVLDAARHKIRRIGDRLGADAHMALLNHLGGGLDVLRHAQARHDDGQAAPRKRRHRHVVLDGRQLRCVAQHAHVVQLVEQQLFVFAPRRRVGRQEGQPVRQLAEGLWRALASDARGEIWEGYGERKRRTPHRRLYLW